MRNNTNYETELDSSFESKSYLSESSYDRINNYQLGGGFFDWLISRKSELEKILDKLKNDDDIFSKYENGGNIFHKLASIKISDNNELIDILNYIDYKFDKNDIITLINQKDNDDNTPLHVAINNKNYILCKWLDSKGVKRVINKDGLVPITDTNTDTVADTDTDIDTDNENKNDINLGESSEEYIKDFIGNDVVIENEDKNNQSGGGNRKKQIYGKRKCNTGYMIGGKKKKNEVMYGKRKYNAFVMNGGKIEKSSEKNGLKRTVNRISRNERNKSINNIQEIMNVSSGKAQKYYNELWNKVSKNNDNAGNLDKIIKVNRMINKDVLKNIKI